MKLYATVTSERDSRPANKGGDRQIEVNLSSGNHTLGTITVTRYSNGLTYVRYYHPLKGKDEVLLTHEDYTPKYKAKT